MKLDHIQSLASYNRLVSLGNFTPAEAAWELLHAHDEYLQKQLHAMSVQLKSIQDQKVALELKLEQWHQTEAERTKAMRRQVFKSGYEACKRKFTNLR